MASSKLSKVTDLGGKKIKQRTGRSAATIQFGGKKRKESKPAGVLETEDAAEARDGRRGGGWKRKTRRREQG
jgi:hypothetical protein